MRIELLEKARFPSVSIRIMAEMLDREGLDTNAALAEAGLTRSALADPGATVSGLQELAFQRAFVARTENRQDLWVMTGRQYRWLHFGVGGLAAATAPTLHALTYSMPDWRHLTYSLTAIEPQCEDGVNIGIAFDMTEVPEFLREFTTYRDLGASMSFFRDVLLLEEAFQRIEVSFPDPGLAALSSLLKAGTVVFDTGRSGFTWGADAALRQLPYADEMLHLDYLCKCQETADAMIRDGTFLELVIAELQRGSEPHSIASVAKRLNVSRRTLQRRLQDHGTTFHQLRGTVLARRARDLLRGTDMTITDISWAIGYSDPANFTHAFRRWTGLSPRSFRSWQGADRKGAG